MTKEAYFRSLTPEQQSQVQSTIERASDQGLDLHIADAVDVWYLIPKSSRGPKPVEVVS